MLKKCVSLRHLDLVQPTDIHLVKEFFSSPYLQKANIVPYAEPGYIFTANQMEALNSLSSRNRPRRYIDVTALKASWWHRMLGFG
jgi:hypothetical protein